MHGTSDTTPRSSKDWFKNGTPAPSPVDGKINAWRASKNSVALGNLAEQVVSRLLPRLGYQVLATQRDLRSGVSNILGHSSRSNPEDFIVITPDDRLATANSKAAYTNISARITAIGDLSAPRMRRRQRDAAYSTFRAALLSPLDGDSFAQVVKVDLVHKLAQVFEVDKTGRLKAIGRPVNIQDDIRTIFEAYPDRMPAPIGPNSSEEDSGSSQPST